MTILINLIRSLMAIISLSALFVAYPFMVLGILAQDWSKFKLRDVSQMYRDYFEAVREVFGDIWRRK